MIYCPKCKTANRDSSRFCNECGEELGTRTSPKCPECGALNPIQNVFCIACGTRLFSSPVSDVEPAPALKGLSLPTKPVPGVDLETPTDEIEPIPDQDLPVWLKELRKSTSPTAATVEDVTPGEGLPDWLRDLEAAPTDERPRLESEVEATGWLAELRASALAEEGVESAPEPEVGEAPVWLAELQTAATGEPIEVIREPDEEEVGAAPAWLAQLRSAGLEPVEAAIEPKEVEEEIPDWLATLQPPDQEPEPAPVGEIEEEAPDWLVQIRAVEEEPALAPEPAPLKSDEIPDWLAQLRPAEQEPEPEKIGAEEEEAPDWLAQIRAAAAEPALAPESAPLKSDEIPDWLAQLRPAEQEPEPEKIGAEAEEAPDWLAQIRAPEEEPALAAESAPLKSDEIPDWLAQLRPTEQEAESEDIDAAAEKIPDWLAQIRAAAEEPALVPEPELLELDQVPDWLAQLRPAEQEAESEDIDAAAEQMPDWLAQLRAAAAEPAALAPEPELLELDEVPDWLREFQAKEEPAERSATTDDGTLGWRAGLREAIPEEPGEEAPEGVATDEAFPWSAELLPEEEAETITAADQVMSVDDITAEGLPPPDWLAAMATPARKEAAPEDALDDAELPEWLVPRAADEGEALEAAAIPDWLLALKPRALDRKGEETSSPTETIEEAVEQTGLLAGLKGTLPVEMLIALPRAAKPKDGVSDSVADTPQARLFAQVVAQPPSVASKAISHREPAVLSRLTRWLLALLLIAAVSIPLVLNQTFLPRTIQPSPAVEALYKSIDALGPGAVVLLSFDYDPATSGELDIVARALVRHLADRQVRMAAVSLLPAGPATAQSLLEQLAAESQYANLGYIPGQVAAVRLLAESWDTAMSSDWQGAAVSDLQALDGVSGLQDFSLVIELAASQDTLRWWIEQAGEPYDIRLGAGVSAAIDPMARSYYETRSQQLVGVVSGVLGAASYDTLDSGPSTPSGTLSARLDAQAAGTLVLILVLVLGNVAYLVRRRSGEER